MLNVIILSFQVNPRTLLGAACCPLSVGGFLQDRRDTILHVLYTSDNTGAVI